MKLKTLKDIEGMCIEQSFISQPKSSDMELTRAMLKQLKTEAIKWVKFWRDGVIDRTEKIACFKNFFKITEEELK